MVVRASKMAKGDAKGYDVIMCELLKEWTPSSSAINLIKLNGINDEQIEHSLNYLKNQTELNDIDDINGYDNWNSFFIMFCVKANAKDKDSK